MFEGTLELEPTAVYFGQVIIRGRLPCVIPGRLVVRGTSLFQTFLVLQREAKIVICVAFGRVRVSVRLPLNRASKVPFSFGKLSAPQLHRAKGGITPAIERVACKSFFPVRFRVPRGMSVLLQMQTGNIQLVI